MSQYFNAVGKLTGGSSTAVATVQNTAQSNIVNVDSSEARELLFKQGDSFKSWMSGSQFMKRLLNRQQ